MGGAYEARIVSYARNTKRYHDEKAAIMSDGDKLETENTGRSSQVLGPAVILLQLAIMLSSIAH
jgi:hypothetical protein